VGGAVSAAGPVVIRIHGAPKFWVWSEPVGNLRCWSMDWSGSVPRRAVRRPVLISNGTDLANQSFSQRLRSRDSLLGQLSA
jgi:hypothetical protein